MIPIKLTIEGLYSYQKRQSIDFKKLTSNHLFGIFGTVGSGKSSILEAITFSLYGKTDRLNLSGDNRNYNMMNLKSDQLFIEFDFIAGKNGQNYRVLVQAKRNSKKFDDVRTLSRTAYEKIDNEYIPISTEKLEDVIGLSYDNFKRTIIIPQGKFQEFLQLGNAERTRMMKELFNLNKYELSFKVKSLETKNNANIQNLKGRLEQIGEISNDQLLEINSKLVDIEKSIVSLSAQQKEQDKKIKDFEKQKEITEKLKSCWSKKNELLQHKGEIDNLQKDLVAYEYCIIHFKSNVDAILLLEKKIKQIENNLSSDNLLYEQNTKEYNTLETNLQLLKKEYDQLDAIKKEIDDTLKIVEIYNSKESIKKNSSRLIKGQNAVKLVSNEIIQLEEAEKNLQENILQLKDQLPDMEELNKAQQWHQTYKLIKDKHSELKKEKENTETQILIAQNKLHDDLRSWNFSFSSGDVKDWLNEIEVCKGKTEEKEKQIKKEIEKLLIHSGLEETAKILKEGDACPLCGSKQHPSPINSKNIAQQITQAKSILNKYELDIKMYDQLKQTLEKYFAGLKPLENQKNSFENREVDVQKEILNIKSTIISKYSEESALEKAILQYKELNSNIVKAETNNKKTREALSKAIKDKDRYKEELSHIEKEIDKHKNAIEILENQVSSETMFKYKNLSIQQITTEKELLEKNIQNIDEKYQKAQKGIEEIKKKLAEFGGRIQANKKHLLEENNSLLEQKSQLEHKLSSSIFNTIPEIHIVLNKTIHIEEAKNKINSYSQNIQNLENEIKLLTLELGDNKYDNIKHEELKNEVRNTKEKQTHSIRLQGELQSLATDLQNKLILKKDITAQLLVFQLKSEDLNTLKKLFHSSGFVNYISSVYLQNLCSSANERFYKMTRQNLSLELNKDNNFEVRDYMNGGNIRSVKTLSGGQTFQAALSLALALSDNIQSMTETNQNFFFLDEGFGSLDKESLEVVFSTLKSLRKENRIVGVISHVEEMQQEIPTYLNILQDEENGSFIEESWGR